ncbi:Putative Zinc finger, RING-type [Septoria linicola]|uniref:Zinc finger, RING-type n=1 Tax=Septoria linicola TaxID=215465 RepID=A0A9Q9ADY9_9PEZI|nr:putative Zinc finger, RING-type [Septoria linicola]USW47360.1 Putative Zinc finger, RING-type [Septoria linicola]
MSGYHVEHGIKEETQQKAEHRRRPDLSTFFSTLDVVDTSGSRQPQNANSLPHPSDISAAYRTLANAFEMMRGSGSSQDPHSDLMESLIESLMSTAEHPPTKVAGVSDEFIAQLERVDKTELQKKADGTCPICSNPFLEDKHPLVVRLPCHDDHIFDLECIEPWLKLNPTCPLDRKELVKKKVEVPKVEDDEEEYDDMYS